MPNSSPLRPRAVSAKLTGRSNAGSRSSLLSAIRGRTTSGDEIRKAEDSPTDAREGPSALSESAANSAQEPSDSTKTGSSQRRGRQRGVTISGGTVPQIIISKEEPVRTLSQWNLDGRVVVEQMVPTSTYPYVVGKAEDIDAMIRPGQEVARKLSMSTRRSGESLESREKAAIGDIDDYITPKTQDSLPNSPNEAPAPRLSFANRLAHSLRLSVSRSPLSPTSPRNAYEVDASCMSFAEVFPGIGDSVHGLPAPVPVAPPETLPESHYPQTLLMASDDIDVLTAIGLEGPLEKPIPNINVTSTEDLECEADSEFDVDKVLNLGEAPANVGPQSNKPERLGTAEKHRKSRLSFANLRASAESLRRHSRSTTQLSPTMQREHQAITAHDEEEKTDIDDILSIDPNPEALVIAALPRLFTDADDFLILGDMKTSSMPALNPGDGSEPVRPPGTGNQATKSAWKSADNLQPSGTQRAHSSLLRSGSRMRLFDSMFDKLNLAIHPNEPSNTPEPYLVRDDSHAAEDIGALLSIGWHPGSGGLHEEEPTNLHQDRIEEHDIEMLLGLGKNDVDVQNAQPARGGSQAQLNQNRTSGESTPASITPPIGRSMNALDRSRVSFIEVDVDAVSAKHSTDPQAAMPPSVPASLDIDQYVAGEPPTTSKRRKDTSFLTPNKDPGSKSRTTLERNPIATSRLDVGEIVPPQVASLRRIRPRSISEPQQRVQSEEPNVVKLMRTLSPPVQRRLTALDINHFMGIADTIEKDRTGMPAGKSAILISDIGEPAASVDIKEILELGEEVGDSIVESSEDIMNTTADGEPELKAASADSASGLGNSTSHNYTYLDRRASSMGHLGDFQRREQKKRMEAVGARSSGALMGTLHEADGNPTGNKRKRRSFDELAFVKRFSKDSMGLKTTEPPVTASIVELAPPKIDIDELLCWGKEIRAAIERKFSVSTQQSSSTRSRPVSAEQRSSASAAGDVVAAA